MTPNQFYMLGGLFGAFFLAVGLIFIRDGNVLGYGLIAVSVANYVRILTRIRRR